MDHPKSSAIRRFQLLPPLPPQPPYFVTDQLQSSEIGSKIKENGAIVERLRNQVDWLYEVSEEAARRLQEYEARDKLLRRQALQYGPRTINDLPPEILILIFQLCCGDVVDLKGDVSNAISFDKSPWILSHVCNGWRQLVHGSPELWAIVPGPIRFGNLRGEFLYLPILLATLDRSRNITLPTASLHHLHPFHEEDAAPRLLQDIAPHLGRIQQLSFICNSEVGLSCLFRIPSLGTEGVLESMHSLVLEVQESHWMWPEEQPPPLWGTKLPPIFSQMSKLTHITFTSPGLIRYEEPFYNLEFPWRQLTSLDIKHATLDEVRHVLQVAPRLQEVKVWEFDDDTPVRRTNHPFVHHHLQHLHLTSNFSVSIYDQPEDSDEDDEIEAFLAFFDLPKLNSLIITFSNVTDPSAIESLIERSQCVLSELGFSAMPDSYASLLRRCPSLKKLVLGGPFRDRELRVFAEPDSLGQWLVPRLETLVVLNSKVSGPNSWIRLIEARKTGNGVRPFQKLEVITSPGPIWFDDETESRWSYQNAEPRERALYDFAHTCKRYTTSILQASCGYEIVNDVLHIASLESLCHLIETVEYDYITDGAFFEDPGLFNPLSDIDAHLAMVEDFDQSGRLAVQYRSRLLKVLCLWTHNPWLNDILPLGWTRADVSDSELPGLDFDRHKALIYRAA